MRPIRRVVILVLLAFFAIINESQAFWSKKEDPPIHCPIKHEVLSTVETVTATKVLRSVEWTTLDFYAPSYVTETMTHIVTSFMPNIYTAKAKRMTVSCSLIYNLDTFHCAIK